MHADILARCHLLVNDTEILLFFGIPICLFLMLKISSKYLKAGLFRTFAYYFSSYVVMAIAMFLLVSFMAVIPY